MINTEGNEHYQPRGVSEANPRASSAEDDSRHGLRLPVVISDPNAFGWNIASTLEAEVFRARNYSETIEEHQQEYRPYQESSVFLLYPDGPHELPLSSMRVIYPSKKGFKTINDIQAGRLQLSREGREILSGVRSDQMLEAGTIGVVPELWHTFGETEASIPLYGGLVALTRQTRAPYVLASFDAEYFERFSRIFGSDCRALGPAVQYMGTPTLPVLMHAEGVVQYAQKRLRWVGDGIAAVADFMQPVR